MAAHSIILAWRTPRIEEPGRLQSMGCKESDMSGRMSSTVEASTEELATGRETPREGQLVHFSGGRS